MHHALNGTQYLALAEQQQTAQMQGRGIFRVLGQQLQADGFRLRYLTLLKGFSGLSQLSIRLWL
ncbi:hypothetical protein THUN1379_31080 [Paludibacterium sp. THUN1379]|nr:hypothetical protein THUN1379_31080 [Paludibacterium sp. THUN1379]